MKIHRLDRAVVSVTSNARTFLNGLTANTLEAPRNAFLNQHGRIIAVFDQVKVNDDEYCLVLPAYCLEAVMGHLSRYARLNKAVLTQKPMNVYFDLEADAPAREGDLTVLQRQGRLLLTGRALPVNVSGEEFTLFRLRHQMPLQGVDFQAEEFILNVHGSEYVSFTKGCFLGQEPVSKVHNRSKPSRKLVVKYADECDDEERARMSSVAVDPASGRAMGFVFVKNI